MENWEGEYYQAKLEDEAASHDVSGSQFPATQELTCHQQLWDILNNESDLKTVMELGEDAVDGLKIACSSVSG